MPNDGERDRHTVDHSVSTAVQQGQPAGQVGINVALVKCEASSSGYDVDITSRTVGDNMIEQTAVVVSIESGYAWIVPQQSGGCGSCSAKSGCATSSASPFDFFRPNREPQKMRVLNTLYARPGDVVVVGMQGDALILYSVLAYLLPLFSLLIFAMLGREAFTWLAMSADLGAVLGGLSGLLGGLKFANVISAHSLVRDDFQPVILRIQGHPTFAVPSL